MRVSLSFTAGCLHGLPASSQHAVPAESQKQVTDMLELIVYSADNGKERNFKGFKLAAYFSVGTTLTRLFFCPSTCSLCVALCMLLHL